jgi:hypothetical protein
VAVAGILPDHWYYNTESGELTKGNNLLNLGNNLLGGLGWHELNIPGSATAAQAAAEAVKEFPKGKTPTTSLATGAANEVQNQTGISAGGLAAIGDFFSKLGQANTWLRVAEVLLGAGIIIVALAKLASDTPAGRAAVKAGKAAAIL